MLIRKSHNFMLCFSSEELKMQALKYMSNEDPQKSWENGVRL